MLDEQVWIVTSPRGNGYKLTVAEAARGEWFVAVEHLTRGHGWVEWDMLSRDTWETPLLALEYGMGAICSHEEEVS